MKLSIVIPAFNEAKLIGRCLERAIAACRTILPDETTWEVIVTDNNSTDATGAIARSAGATVVFERINQISRARNAGAAVATGDWLLFIDADSFLSPETLADVISAIRTGGIGGGGCAVKLDEMPARWAPALWLWDFASRRFRIAAGTFIFCRADAFRAVGGFSARMYAAEEIQFSRKLKRWSRKHGLDFIILTAHPHITSGRKFKLYSQGEILRFFLRSLLLPWTIFSRKRLGFFYDGRR
jgi:glycosyltransferase involved in cell wall biosynthesis